MDMTTETDCVTPITGTNGESVGRMCHYINLGDADGKFPPEIISALITKVNADGTIAIKTFYASGTFDLQNVYFSPTYKRGHWSWPVAMREKAVATA